ncbi:GNAT family N-acetyltransferase [Paenibacillus hodogayensis]|uniref:GNAT family N-acetyltransferase n=1 Tax=Paenibacillus hodogayensis TaxID=279208 RepID=A0ABV5VX71_9BACL
MELRPYRQTDRDSVLNLHELALREAGVCKGDGSREADLRDIEGNYLAAGGEFWVGEADGELIATGAFHKTSEDTAEIKRMLVTPDRQRGGCGRLLLNKLEERAREQGCAMLHLDTTEEQTAARRLYESAGYTMHERRVIDGDDRFLYAKWLVPPEAAKEMTPEEEAKFYADWDASQEINEYAKGLLREGATPQQAMERVLGSQLYAAWIGKERCFQTEYDRIGMYEDLLSSVESESYIAGIEEKEALYFAAAGNGEADPDLPRELPEEEYERVFAQNGIRVTLSRLAREMAEFSRAIGFTKPIRYVHFLAIFSGAAIVDMEQEELDRLVANKELAIELAETFAAKYGEDRDGSDE